MKPKYSLVRVRAARRSFIPSILAAALALALSVKQGNAAILYWDLNGTTANTAVAVTGAWDGTNVFWNTDSTGTGGTAQAGTTNADDLFFSSGSIYTTGTITASGTRAASSINFEDPIVTTLAGAVTIGGTGTKSGIFALSTTAANNSTVSGALTLGAASTIQNAGTGVLAINGGITGAFNLTLQNNGATTNGVTISTGALNNGGTVTNSGSGAGNTLISSVIGTSVTGVTQNSANSQLTLSNAANTFNSAITITQGQLNAGSVTGFGSAIATTNVNLGSASTVGIANYTAAAAGSTRPFVVGGAAGGQLLNNGTGLLTLTATAPILNLAAGPLTIGGSQSITLTPATLAVPVTGGNTLTKTGAGTVTLNTSGTGTSATISGATPIVITAGTLQQTSTQTTLAANSLGTGTIRFNPANAGTATLGMSFASVTNTYSNTINVDAPTTGTSTSIISVSAGATFSGPIVLGTGAGTGIATLRFTNTNGALFTITASGGITGTGNLSLNGTGTNAPITLSGSAINITGSITNIGTNGAAASVATISAPITTTNLTAISQQGASPFTISSSVALTSALNTFTSTGSGLWTFNNASTFTGTQPLTFNANSTGGITVSGTNLNHTGTVTNSGTNGGTTTISSAIGANVGTITQNSASSPLVLSGNNSAYTGTYTITNGLMQFSNTAAMTGFTGTPNANVKISVASSGMLALGYGSAGQFTASDLTALVNGAGTTYPNVTFANGASISLDTTTASTTFASALTNPSGAATFGLVKVGTNTLTLGNANTYTGRTWVQNGILSAGTLNSVATPAPSGASSLGVPSSVANGTISLGFLTNTGVLSYTGVGASTDRVINLAGTTGGGGIDNSGTGTLIFTSPITFTGTGAKTLTVSGAANTTFSAAVAGGGTGSTSPLTIAKTGTGTLLLGAPGSTVNTNTVTQLNISGGIVDIGTSGLTISNSGATVIDSTANVTINATGGGTLTISSSAGTNAGDIRPASGTTLTINANISTPVTNTGFWTGQGGGLELNNTGTLVLNGNNTIAGVTSITAAGTISVGNIAQNLGGTTGLLFSTAGSRFLYTGAGETTAVPLQPNANCTVEQAGLSGTLNFSANWATGASAKTVTLQGSTAGLGVISGIISNNSATNTTAITKAGTGTWTLSANNTYTGATTVSGGNLRLTNGGSTSNSAVTVNNGGTLSIVGNYTIGNAATAAAGGRLTLTAGGTLDLADGAINDLTLTQNATFASAGAAFNGGTIRLDVSGTDADSIINSGGTVGSSSSGVTSVVINPIAGFGPGTYTIISGGAGSSTISANTIVLATNTVSYLGAPYTLALSQSGKDVVLTITAGAGVAPGLAYWNGTTNASWAHQPGGVATATNWVAAPSGGPDTLSLPGDGATGTNVFLSSNSVAGSLSTTLDAAFNINSLNFTGTGTSNTAGAVIDAGSGGTLTLNGAAVNGNTAGNGMTVLAGSGANLISAPVILGANQTWTNNATTVTNISSVISEASAGLGLTKAGTGPMTFSGAASNTYTGLTTVIGSGSTAGALTLAKTGGALAIPGNLTIGSGTATQAHVLLGENEQISPTATVTFNAVTNGWGYLQVQGRTQTIGNIVETNPGFGVIETREAAGTFGNSNIIFNVASGTQTYQGYFRDINTGLGATNSLKLTKTGSGTLQWGAANSAGAAGTTAGGHAYSGGTDIQNGTLQLLAANTASAISIVGAGNVSLNGGATVAGTLDLNGLNAGITGLDGTTGTVLGRVVNNGSGTATLSIGNNGNNGNFAGSLLDNSNAGTGILAVTKVGAGTQVLSGANSHTGATTLTAGTLSVGVSANLGAAASNLVFDGGTLQITGNTLSNFTGIGHTVLFNATKNVGLDISNAAHIFTVDQVLNQTTGGFTKLGAGTVILNQSHTYTGNTNVSGGNLVIDTGASLATAKMLVGYGGTSGAVNFTNTANLSFAPGSGNDFFSLGGGGGYGYARNSGGTVTSGQFALGGNSAGSNTTGVFEQTSGSYTMGTVAGWILSGWVGTDANGVMNVYGGTVNNNSTSNPTTHGFLTNVNSFGMYNVMGSTAVFNTTTTQGFDLARSVGNFAGVLNINGGGTVAAAWVRATAASPSFLGFNNGTLRANAANTTFVSGLTNATIYSGGATIDSNGVAITIPQALLAPTGSGLDTIPVSSGGSGYIGAPAVRITGGGGSGATAIATVDLNPLSGTYGQVTGFTITSAGSGYTSAPTVTLIGGGATVAATPGTPTTTVNATTGGLTKIGAGTLILSSPASTIGGAVTITGGTLQSSGLGTLANIGANSALGTGDATSDATNAASLVLNGGIYSMTGTNASVSTNRLFTVTQNGGGLSADNGTSTFLVSFNNTNAIAYTGSGARTLTLTGAHSGSATNIHTLAPLIGNAGSDVVSITKTGTTAWLLANAGNSYTGPTTITQGILGVSKLSAGGANSGIGASSSAAANLVLQGGTLLYNGTGDTTDRNFTFGNAITAAGGGIDTTGATGPLVITGSMTGANAAAGTQVLTLTSLAASGANTISGNIVDSSGAALTGVTKAGAGLWTLAGTNTYSGTTTISAGTLQLAGANSLSSTTPISLAGGAILQIRDDSAGSIDHTSNNITASGSGTLTIDVGNNGGATTGSTVAFGALSSGTAANAVTYNFTGANGYLQSYSSLALPGATGNNTTFNPTTTSVTVTGNVTSQMSGFTASNFNTLFLGGTTSGNAINGVISDAVGASPTANGLTRITKQGTSTWTLGGVSTFRGITTVNGGTLRLAAGSGLANTAITVNPATSGLNPTFAVTPGTGTINLGSTGVTGLGATLTLNPGTAAIPIASAFTMQDNAVGTVNLNQEATFTGNALTLGGTAAVGYVPPVMSFDIGGTSLTDIDALNVTKLATVGTGGVIFNFAALSGSTSLTAGDYTFLNAPSGGLSAGGVGYILGTSTISVGSTTYSLSLANSTTTAAILTVTPLTGNASAFWQGDVDGSWSSFPGGTNTNFATSLTGATDIGALPDLNSNVAFTTTTASNLSTTLDANFTINSLSFNAAGSTIASGTGTNTLAINAAALNGNLAGNGISVGSGAGLNTISAPIALGASQSWNVASGASLAVSGDVSGTGFALTLPGNGTVILSGNNTYSGGTNLNAGQLIINSATAIGTGPLTVVNATIDNTTANPITLTDNNTQTWANNGALAFTGTRSLNLGSGAVTLGDAATANFTLSNNAAPASSVLTIGGAITGGSAGTAGVKTLTVAGTGDIVLSGNITRGATATGLDLTVTHTGNVTLSGASTVRTLNANGGSTSVIDIGAGTLTLSNTGAQTINSTGGTINGTGSIVLSGNDASPGDNGVATGATLTINAKLTGNTRFEYFSATQFGTFVLNNVNNDFNDIVMNQTGTISVPSLGNAGSNGPAGKGAIILNSNAAVFRYTGTGETSNKSINLSGTTTGGTLDQSGPSGNLNLTTFGTPGAGVKTLTLQGSTAGTGQISGAIINNSGTNTTGVTKNGTGLWNLSGANLFTGATTVNGGILRLSGTSGATPITINTGGTLQVGAATAVTAVNNVTLAGTGTLDLFGNSFSIGSLTSTATNVITNSSSNVTASTATAPGTPSGAGVYVDALIIATAGPTAAALITDGPTRKTQIVLNNVNASNATTNTANTYSGGLVLAHNASGTRLSPGAITGTPWGTGPIIIGQATTDRAGLYFATANQTLANPLVFNSVEGNDVVGAARVDVATTFTGTQTAGLSAISYGSFSGAGSLTVSGRLTGSGTFTGTIRAGGLGGGTVIGTNAGLIVGASNNNTTTVILSNSSANNDYTGDTFVTGRGVLRLGAVDQIPNGTGFGNVVVAASGVLNLNGFSETINGLSGAGAVDGTSGTPTLTLGDNNATGNNFSGIIRNTAGALAVTKIGTGNQTLSGANTYTGNTTVSQGTLTFAGGTIYNSNNTSTVTIASGAEIVASASTLNVLGFGSGAIWNISGTFNSSGGGAQTLPGTINLNNGTMTGVANSTFGTFLGNASYTVTITANGASNAITAANFGIGTGHLIAVNTPLSTDALSITSGLGLASQTGSLTKTGQGTVTLSGANRYIGATTVAEGTLALVGGSQSSPITVSFGASLGFTLGSPTTSTSTFNLTTGTIKITGTPTLDSYDLITNSNGITGTPALHAAIPGYLLKKYGNTLRLISLYQDWADVNNVTGAKGADDDGDGYSNLMEYAFGTNPKVASSGSITYLNGLLTAPGQPVLVEDSGVYFAVFGRRADYVAAGLTYTVQFSAELGTWTDGVTVPTVIATDGTIDAVSVPFPNFVPSISGPKKPTFFRVVIAE